MAFGLLTESTTHVHGLIDEQVHNYSPECSGCYNCDSGTRAYEQYVVNIEVVKVAQNYSCMASP